MCLCRISIVIIKLVTILQRGILLNCGKTEKNSANANISYLTESFKILTLSYQSPRMKIKNIFLHEKNIKNK